MEDIKIDILYVTLFNYIVTKKNEHDEDEPPMKKARIY